MSSPFPVATGKLLAPWTPRFRALPSLPLAPWPPLGHKDAAPDHLLLSPSIFRPLQNPNPKAPWLRSDSGRRRSPPTIGGSRSESAWGKRSAGVSSSSSSEQSSSGALHRRVGVVSFASVRRTAVTIPAPSVHLGLRRLSTRAQGEHTVPRDISSSLDRKSVV